MREYKNRAETLNARINYKGNWQKRGFDDLDRPNVYYDQHILVNRIPLKDEVGLQRYDKEWTKKDQKGWDAMIKEMKIGRAKSLEEAKKKNELYKDLPF